MKKVFEDIAQERIRQDTKWGKQTHPSVDQVLTNREGGCTPERMCEEYEIPSENRAKQNCDINAKRGECTWAHIAVEEMSEVVSCKNDADRRGELVQLAAVVVAWIEDIDNKAKFKKIIAQFHKDKEEKNQRLRDGMEGKIIIPQEVIDKLKESKESKFTLSNFINKCVSGEASIEQIDDYIDSWHNSPCIIPLHMYLGMSWDEYSDFVKDRSTLNKLIHDNR